MRFVCNQMDRHPFNRDEPEQPRPDRSAAEAEGPPAPSIPDHELLRRIGRGSYGDVWLARNMMGVYRAVKIVYRRAFKDARPFERELSGIRKFEPVSRSHEGFVDVLHVGINENQGYFYYVMELGDDQSLGQTVIPDSYSPKTLSKEISTHGRLPFEACLQLGLAISLALTELHKCGLVHRDVKPSNLIFVNGVPKLADIGLVAEMDEARSYVGTEGFIPPEGPGAPQADVYSLGKVLYEAATGNDRQEFPELPADFDRFPDREAFLELNEVILQACRTDLKQRYRSAWDMHAHLLVLANGKSVKRLRLLETRLANLKRGAGISSLVILVLAVISYQIYSEWQNALATRQRQVGANVAYGNRAMDSGNFLGALPYFTEALRLDRGEPQQEREDRLRIGSILSQSAKLEQLWSLGHQPGTAQFSPDGQQVLITLDEGGAYCFNAVTGKPVPLKFKTDGEYDAVYSPDGTRILTAGDDGSASVWRISDGKCLLKLRQPSSMWGARFSPDGRLIVTAGADGTARVWNARTGKLEHVLTGHSQPILFAGFSHDGHLIVTTSQDGTARLWDAANGRPAKPPLHCGGWVYYASFSPDDRRLVVATSDFKAQVWNLATGKEQLPELNEHDIVNSAEFSPDGRLLVTSCLDGNVRLWRADNLQPLRSNAILTQSSRVVRATFGPEGRRILVICSDGTARIWDLAGAAVPPPAKEGILSHNGGRLLTLNVKAIHVYDTESDKPLGRPIWAQPPVESAAFSRNGRFLVSISKLPATSTNTPIRQLRVWLSATGQAVAPPLLIPHVLAGVCLNDSGTRLVAFGGKSARIWNVRTGRPLSEPLQHGAKVSAACFSPDGSCFATSSTNEVRVWSTDTGRLLYPPLEHREPVDHVEFSPDGSRLVTCCSDNFLTPCYAQVWNTATGQPVGPRLRHKDGVLYASFSPHGRRVVTASEDFTAIVWDAATGRQLTPPLRHGYQVRSARFSPDDRWIVTASQDKTARIWSADTGDLLAPPFRPNHRLARAIFLPDDHGIVTLDWNADCQIWTLPVDKRPIKDLVSLARLMSSGSETRLGQLNQPEPADTVNLWKRLRTQYPASFTTSPGQVAAWHRFQAQLCESQHQWFGAVFHLRRLLALHPGDPSLMKQLAQAKASETEPR